MGLSGLATEQFTGTAGTKYSKNKVAILTEDLQLITEANSTVASFQASKSDKDCTLLEDDQFML